MKNVKSKLCIGWILFLWIASAYVIVAQVDTITIQPGQSVVIVSSEQAVQEPEPEPVGTQFYVNTTNNIDHYPNLRGKGARYFWNVEHDLPFNGILQNGGKMAKNHTFIPTNEMNDCIGVDYNGSMCDNAMRVKKLSNQFDIVMVVPQAVKNPFDFWLNWPNKFIAMWIWGDTGGLQYAKIKEHFLALLWSTHGNIDFVQIANEPWGMSPAQYNIVESARVDAWLEYNTSQGLSLDDYEQFTPKLVTAAMPIGQGLQTELSFQNLANSKFAKYYYSVAVHGYNRTPMSEWSSDASITNEIIDMALEFCRVYMPHCSLQITETGAPNDIIDQHIQSLKAKTSEEEGIDIVWLYNLFSDGSDIFKNSFFLSDDGVPTEAAIKYNIITN